MLKSQDALVDVQALNVVLIVESLRVLIVNLQLEGGSEFELFVSDGVKYLKIKTISGCNSFGRIENKHIFKQFHEASIQMFKLFVDRPFYRNVLLDQLDVVDG